MHIAALKFTALANNVVLHGAELRGYHVELLSDSLVTVFTANNGVAKAPMPQRTLRPLRATLKFQALFLTRNEFHVAGEVNFFADTASRLKLGVIHGLSAQLGIAVRRIQLPARALHFFEVVRAEARRIHLEIGRRA